MATTIDMPTAATSAIEFAMIALPLIAAAATAFSATHQRFQRVAAMISQVSDAVTHAGGLMTQHIADNAANPDQAQVRKDGLSLAVDYVIASQPENLKATGLDPEKTSTEKHLEKQVIGTLAAAPASTPLPPAPRPAPIALPAEPQLALRAPASAPIAG